MAKRTSVKSALSSSVAVVPGVGHNNPPDAGFSILPTGWDAKRCMSVAAQGFQDTKDAEDKHGTAYQRVAAAIMGLFTIWHDKGHPADRPAKDGKPEYRVRIYRLADMVPSGDDKSHDEGKRKMRALLIEAFHPNKTPKEMVEQRMPVNERSAFIKMHRRVTQTVNRALSLAAILHADGVTLDDFMPEHGCFRVLPKFLIEPASDDKTPWIGTGLLRNADTKILLNNASHMLMRDMGTENETLLPIQASGDQVSRVYRLEKGLIGGQRAPRTPSALPENLTAEMFVAAAKTNKDALVGMIHAVKEWLAANQKDTTLASLPTDAWNDLEEMNRMVDGMQDRPNFFPPGYKGKNEMPKAA